MSLCCKVVGYHQGFYAVLLPDLFLSDFLGELPVHAFFNQIVVWQLDICFPFSNSANTLRRPLGDISRLKNDKPHNEGYSFIRLENLLSSEWLYKFTCFWSAEIGL